MNDLKYKLDRLWEISLIPILKILFDTFIHSKKSVIEHDEINKILIVALNRGIGDAVLFSPALVALKKALPKTHIVIVVNSYVKDIVNRYHSVDEIMIYDANKMNLKSKMKFVNQLRSHKFDLAFDLIWNKFLESAVLTSTCGAKYTVGFDHDFRSLFFNHRYRTDFENKHVVDLILGLIKSIGIEECETEFERFEPDESYTSDCIDIFNNNGISKQELVVGIQPGARDALDFLEKRWSTKGYAQLTDYLIRDCNAKVIFFGDPSEIKRGNEVLSYMRYSPINLIGRTTIEDVIVLLKRCDLLICNNSGLLHIAVSMNIPTVSFSGVNNIRWGPYIKDLKHKVLHLSEPQKLKTHKDISSFMEMKVSVVVKAVEEQLASLGLV
jgi:heptosyltransferase-2